MAEDLKVLVAAIRQELELARSGEGYEEGAVAEEIVAKLVAPLLERAVMEEALRWRPIVDQWERGHQDEVLPYTANLEADRDLLLWLHAEAVWKLGLPCGSCHPCMHWSSELWRRIDREPPTPDRWLQTVDERNALLVEVERLRREAEFEANAVDWPWTPRGVCACVTDEQAAVIVAGGFSRPVCTVHPNAAVDLCEDGAATGTPNQGGDR